MHKFIKFLLVGALVFFSSASIPAAPPTAMVQRAKTLAENVRYQLPAQIMYGISLTKVVYDSKTSSLVYDYHYTLPIQKKLTAQSVKEVKQGVIHFLKANPDSDDMQFLKSGISYIYNYYKLDGTFLIALRITSADIE